MVVAVSDIGAKVEEAMKRADKIERSNSRQTPSEIERDAASAGGND